MKILTYNDKKEIINLLKQNKVGIMPTDTVYGLIAIYREENLVKLNKIKKRSIFQPVAILVSSLDMAEKIAVISYKVKKILNEYPKGTLSVIVYSKSNPKETISLRITNDKWLQLIIETTGPLYATSANLHTRPVITQIKDNELKVDFIVDGGIISKKASTIINTLTNPIIIIRN